MRPQLLFQNYVILFVRLLLFFYRLRCQIRVPRPSFPTSPYPTTLFPFHLPSSRRSQPQTQHMRISTLQIDCDGKYSQETTAHRLDPPTTPTPRPKGPLFSPSSPPPLLHFVINLFLCLIHSEDSHLRSAFPSRSLILPRNESESISADLDSTSYETPPQSNYQVLIQATPFRLFFEFRPPLFISSLECIW